MTKSFNTIASAAGLLAGVLVATAAPAAAEDIQMPDIKGMTLQNAYGALESTTGGDTFSVSPRVILSVNQVVYNKANWIVCGQYPNPGDAIAADQKVLVTVARPPGC